MPYFTRLLITPSRYEFGRLTTASESTQGAGQLSSRCAAPRPRCIMHVCSPKRTLGEPNPVKQGAR